MEPQQYTELAQEESSQVPKIPTRVNEEATRFMNNNAIKLIDHSENCKHWSGEDALVAAQEIVSAVPRPVKKLLALWYEPNEDGSSELNYVVAGLSREEHIAMLQVFLHKATLNFLK